MQLEDGVNSAESQEFFFFLEDSDSTLTEAYLYSSNFC